MVDTRFTRFYYAQNTNAVSDITEPTATTWYNYVEHDRRTNQWNVPNQQSPPSPEIFQQIIQTQASNAGTAQSFNYQLWSDGPSRIQQYANGASSNQWVSDNTTATWNYIDTGSKAYKVKDALMKIFMPPTKELLKDLTEDEKKLFKAKEVSEKLLKDWLSPDEYLGLKTSGEISIPSKHDPDCLFIVKRDPNQMVEVRKNGKYSHKLCVIAKNSEMPVGDQLLSKLLLLKNDEQKFVEVAIRHG